MAKSSKRTYVKKSPYWDKKAERKETVSTAATALPYIKPKLVGGPLVSTARQPDASNRTRTRRNQSSKGVLDDRYSNIRGGLLPFESSEDGITVRDAIELCQKAYANIALFRNVIDMMAEFSNNEIYFEGGTKEARAFFQAWFKKINMWNMSDQYFREYFRGGNVFMMRVDGKFSNDDFFKMVKKRGAKANKIPVKYIMLNPKDIVARHVSHYDDNSYEKVLSQYDIKRLVNPTTEEDERLFKSLPPKTQKDLKNNTYNQDGVYMKLDPDRLYFSFYKKQDYEAFAIPFGFPVLADLNMKQEFKNMDASILRTVENVILLVTNGAKPDEGGVNSATIADLQTLFSNESSGRVLVADYTTKAEFAIPDLKKVLGPEKYKVLDQDIKDGLQNIMLADDSHSTADIKTKVFLDRLKEARQQFLNDFLQKEIDRVSQDMGFRKTPVAKFKEIDMKDDIQLMTVGTRLMEIGILTPEQGLDFMRRGELPSTESLEEAQEALVKSRKKGHYNPLVGGVPAVPPPADPNAKKMNETPNSKGRPVGAKESPKAKTTTQKLAASVKKIDSFYKYADKAAKKFMEAEELNKEQQTALLLLCERIIGSVSPTSWKSSFKSCLNSPEKIGELGVNNEIDKLSRVHNLSISEATLLYYSLEKNEI
jgi:hypothetical protein